MCSGRRGVLMETTPALLTEIVPVYVPCDRTAKVAIVPLSFGPLVGVTITEPPNDRRVAGRRTGAPNEKPRLVPRK